MTDEKLAEIEAFTRRWAIQPNALTPAGLGIPVYADLEPGEPPECRDANGRASIHVSCADFAVLRQPA